MYEIVSNNQNKDFINQKPTILVIGVGGGGGNAINQMIEKEIQNVTYISVNTDAAALASSRAEYRIQIGKQLLSGLGAGAKPDLGKSAMEEDKKELEAYLDGVEMVFLTCGLGGGTGTGAIPVIANMCKERNILTVAVVTTPFFTEGFIRNSNSQQGLDTLKSCVDTLLVIPNDKLLETTYQDFTFEDCLKLADNVLVDSVSAICNIIFQEGMINIDFGDVRTIMENTGLAYIGFGKSQSSNGLMEALEEAVHSPLLETDIHGAKKLIINCSGRVNMNDMQQALKQIHSCTNPEANIILGTVTTPDTEGEICVTLIATELTENTENTRTMPFSNQGSVTTKKTTSLQNRPQTTQPLQNRTQTPNPASQNAIYREPAPYVEHKRPVSTTAKPMAKTSSFPSAPKKDSREIRIPTFLKGYTSNSKL